MSLVAEPPCVVLTTPLDASSDLQCVSRQPAIGDTQRLEQIFNSLPRVNAGGGAEDQGLSQREWMMDAVGERHAVRDHVHRDAQQVGGATGLGRVFHDDASQPSAATGA